jgi:hypothetical protein
MVDNDVLQVYAKTNRVEDVADSYGLVGFGPADQYGLFRLTPGKPYVVYAVSTVDKYDVLAVGDDDVAWCAYPRWYDARLFLSPIAPIPSHWRSGIDTGLGYDRTIHSFPEWADHPDAFYARLLDEEEPEMEIFEGYRQRYAAAPHG